MNAALRPTIARLKPYLVEVQAGKTYLWCACGRSARQPFCDGSHKGTGFEPRKFVAQANEEILLCGCKNTGTQPHCDGTHTNLPGGSPLDDPYSVENRAVQPSTERHGPRTMLNGSCYVFSPGRAQLEKRGTLSYCYVISGELGAVYQTQILLRVQGGASPILTFSDCHAILFVSGGAGTVTICGQRFDVKATDGVYIRPRESFQLTPAHGAKLEAFASACPKGEITWLDAMPQDFDARFPDRVVCVDVN
ncbi:MAG: CDGSH iron-sulfur domain-containing protein, partial [Steroidobacterales bacterium]